MHVATSWPDAYDNALAESQIGLYKAELIRPEGPWWGVEHVEIETLKWVDFFNNERPTARVPERPDPDCRQTTSLRCTKRAPRRPAEPPTRSSDSPGRFTGPAWDSLTYDGSSGRHSVGVVAGAGHAPPGAPR